MIVLSLSIIFGGLFLVYVARVFLTPDPGAPLRMCALSDNYSDLDFWEMRKKYHWTLDALLEERMNMYEGTHVLSCSGEDLDDVIPAGEFASVIAESLPYVPNSPNFTYEDFDLLLTEWFRTYDCHLWATSNRPNELLRAFHYGASSSSSGLGVGDMAEPGNLMPFITEEREIARRAFDRALTLIRPSEEYLPLHASLRCLQRASEDVRNAVALIGDVNQCVQTRLASPDTSLLKTP